MALLCQKSLLLVRTSEESSTELPLSGDSSDGAIHVLAEAVSLMNGVRSGVAHANPSFGGWLCVGVCRFPGGISP